MMDEYDRVTKSHISEEMKPLSKELLDNIERYARKISEHNQDILSIDILTSGISLFVTRFWTKTNDTITSAWAFYPRTGCESYISSMSEDNETLECYRKRSVKETLKRHNWFNPDVETVLRQVA